MNPFDRRFHFTYTLIECKCNCTLYIVVFIFSDIEYHLMVEFSLSWRRSYCCKQDSNRRLQAATAAGKLFWEDTTKSKPKVCIHHSENSYFLRYTTSRRTFFRGWKNLEKYMCSAKNVHEGSCFSWRCLCPLNRFGLMKLSLITFLQFSGLSTVYILIP